MLVKKCVGYVAEWPPRYVEIRHKGRFVDCSYIPRKRKQTRIYKLAPACNEQLLAINLDTSNCRGSVLQDHSEGNVGFLGFYF
jgi:hypothetical protein